MNGRIPQSSTILNAMTVTGVGGGLVAGFGISSFLKAYFSIRKDK